MEYLLFLPARHTFLLRWATAPPFSSAGPSSMSLPWLSTWGFKGVDASPWSEREHTTQPCPSQGWGVWEEGVTGPNPDQGVQEKFNLYCKCFVSRPAGVHLLTQAKLFLENQMTLKKEKI